MNQAMNSFIHSLTRSCNCPIICYITSFAFIFLRDLPKWLLQSNKTGDNVDHGTCNCATPIFVVGLKA